MTQNVEAGMRNYRVEFARESDFADHDVSSGTDWLKYSGVLNTFSWESDSEPATRRAIGSADPVEFQKASESHTFSVEYDMLKWFTTGGGTAHDASYDALARDSDNQLPNSHMIVSREDKSSISAEHTVNGSTSYGTRIYSVGRGALADSLTVSGEASDAAIATVELEYMVHKARSYQIDQPDSSTLLVVESTDAADNTQTLTIEDEGAGTTEDVSLDGTNLVSTTSQFADIDAMWLDAECAGDVKISINTGAETSPTAGDQLSVIYGKDSYDGTEGDRGVPAMGGGSRESVPSQDYQAFQGSNIDRGGSAIPHNISSASIVVENDIEDVELTSSYGMNLYPGSRELTFEATMFSEAASHDNLVENLQTTQSNIDWTLTGGTVTLTNAVLSEPGAREVEEGQAVMTLDNTFIGDGLTISES